MDAKQLFLYQGGRVKPIIFTGHSGKIKEIKLKHKSKISGKENSKTEFYYKVLLEKDFSYNDKQKEKLNTKILFSKNDKTNKELFRKYLPTITTLEKIELNNKQTEKANAKSNTHY